MLIATSELQDRIALPSVLIFDCRHDLFDHAKGLKAYQAGHVPRAHFVPVETVMSGAKTGRNGRHPLPAPEDFAAFLNGVGVTPQSLLVAYDDAGNQYAARFWWLARWIGHESVAVLDGGLGKWAAEGRPITTAAPIAQGGGSIVPRPNPRMVVTVAELEQSLPWKSLQVVDARAAERFRGEKEPIDPVAGRIPGAMNRFVRQNLNSDLTMRSPAELREEFEALLGPRRSTEVVHQCGSGVAACMNVLAMEHAGLKGSRLYAGSWSEWIADPRRPVERG